MHFIRFTNLAWLCVTLAVSVVLEQPTNNSTVAVELRSPDVRSLLARGVQTKHVKVQHPPVARPRQHKSKPTKGSRKGGRHNGRTSSPKGKHTKSKLAKQEHSKGQPEPVLIFPKKGMSASNQQKFESLFKHITHGSKLVAIGYVKKNHGILLWRARLTADQTAQLTKEAHHLIETIEKDQPQGPKKPLRSKLHGKVAKHGGTHRSHAHHQVAAKHHKRTWDNDTDIGVEPHALSKRVGSASIQHNAPWELVQLSLSRDKHMWDDPPPKEYRYTTPAGQGVRIYGIDGGLNKEHSEVRAWLSRPTRPELKWIFASEWHQPPDRETDAADGHGSIVWSKAVSPTYGVARDAHYTAVKIEDDLIEYEGDDGQLKRKMQPRDGDILQAYWMTFLDIDERKRHVSDKINEMPSVVATSIGTTGLSPQIRHALSQIVGWLADCGVPIFYAAANTRYSDGTKDVYIDDIGDSMVAFKETHDNIFIVGGTDREGEWWSHSVLDDPSKPDNPKIDFWAPAQSVTTIKGHGHSGIDVAEGNSFAAPLVAGLAADFMAKNPHGRGYADVGRALKAQSVHRAREEWHPKVVANDQVPRE